MQFDKITKTNYNFKIIAKIISEYNFKKKNLFTKSETLTQCTLYSVAIKTYYPLHI